MIWLSNTPPERICATFNHAAIILTDPSRERSQVLMQLAKPIPFALLFDIKAIALDDRIMEE